MIVLHRLIKHLPSYERKSELINAILYSISNEVEYLKLKSDESYAELFIDTAIKTLDFHERDLNIPKSSINLKQRRELVTAHYRAALEQTTEETIKNVASAFSNGEVEINETDTPGLYEIKFVGEIGIPDNMEGLKQTMEIILPAHLEVIYAFTFATWGDIKHLTWADLENFTWEEVLNGGAN